MTLVARTLLLPGFLVLAALLVAAGAAWTMIGRGELSRVPLRGWDPATGFFCGS
jgi:hypothetical protein